LLSPVGANNINSSNDRTTLAPTPMIEEAAIDIDGGEVKVDTSLKNLIKDRSMFINLMVLLFLWVASAFDYYLISF
jgi:hypothetical protein